MPSLIGAPVTRSVRGTSTLPEQEQGNAGVATHSLSPREQPRTVHVHGTTLDQTVVCIRITAWATRVIKRLSQHLHPLLSFDWISGKKAA